MPVPMKNLTGMVFSDLTVIGPAPRWRRAMQWYCMCKCGKVTTPVGAALKNGTTKSCGCHAAEILRKTTTKHGHSASGKTTPEYQAWVNMRMRCSNPVVRDYHVYGGRGIRVCEEWGDFAAFYGHIGPRPSSKHSLDRVDNNGHYEPGNVRWATPKEQALNRRTTTWYEWTGDRRTPKQIAALEGIGYERLLYWLNKKRFSVEAAVAEIKRRSAG